MDPVARKLIYGGVLIGIGAAAVLTGALLLEVRPLAARVGMIALMVLGVVTAGCGISEWECIGYMDPNKDPIQRPVPKKREMRLPSDPSINPVRA